MSSTDNRHTISEMDLVRPEQLLEKGIPLPLLSGKYEVKEGFCAVVTEGSVYKEVLGPGFYHLHKYKLFRDVRATVVDMRIKRLEMETSRVFSMRYPVPVQLDLDLSVDYRVADPRMVALEIEEPLHTLYDRINQSLGPLISNSNYKEVLEDRDAFSERMGQKIIGQRFGKLIGIDVLNVIITKLRALDAGDDALGAQILDEYTTVRNWQVDSTILANSQMDMMTMLKQASPDKRIELLQDMVDKGFMDPAGGFLNQPTNNPNANYNPNQMMNQLMSGFNAGQAQGPMTNVPSNAMGQNQLTPGTPGGGQDRNARMQEEVNLLKQISGINVDTKTGVDENGLPNGFFNFRLQVPKQSGGEILCYFSCTPQYPSEPPLMMVEVDGEDYPFESANLRNWRGQYMVEIVREVINGVN
jgi:hypothetical protein